MENEKKLLKKIKESLGHMSEEKYYHIREFKYIWFAKDGEYGGCGHYKLNLMGTPLEKAEPLTYLAPMASKKAMIAAIQKTIDQLGQASQLIDKKSYLSTKELEDHLFGPHADNYNRLFKFFEIEDFIRPQQFGSVLRKVYHDSVKKYRYRYELRKAFLKAPKYEVMTEAEKNYWYKLDERVTIFRAMSSKENDLEDYGVSWTLYEEIALEIGKICFDNIWDQAEFLVKKIDVAKTDLRAYFNERNMGEVVYVQNEIPDQTLDITLL